MDHLKEHTVKGAKKILRRLRKPKKNRRRNNRGPVGTEAKAIANLERNRKDFKYPPEGFVTKIEYSLLYNIIDEPSVYPEETAMKHIAEEDFTEYMVVASKLKSSSNNSNFGEDAEEEINYAQLSAILALASEKYPANNNNNVYANDETRTSSSRSSSKLSVAETLCKVVLRTIIEYIEENGLDRESELREVMEPVERHFIKRDNKHQLRMNLPFYLGYTATILTLNPLPMIVGAGIMCGSGDKMSSERSNVESISTDSYRRQDAEKTGLLDESF